MRNISIITFVNLIFFIASIALFSTFLLFLQFDKNRYLQELQQRYFIISSGFLSGLEFIPSKEELEKLLNEYHIKDIKNENKKLQIIRKHKEIFKRESFFGRVRVYKVNNDFYIYVQKFGYNLFLKDEKVKEYKYFLPISIFVVLLLIILFLYFSIIKKIKPLYLLKKSVDNFASGNLDVKIDKNSNDEIGKIAESFNNAVVYINKLIESKNLFMRNMMHELKTPVTKGRIVSEMVKESENRAILIKVFNRINEIINELSKIEKVNTDILQLKIEKIFVTNLIEKSRKLLMISKKQIIFEGDDRQIDVDIELFNMALKNLIHNAIKFSDDKLVIIKIINNTILIGSKSKPLTKDLNFYLEPFYQEEKREDGLGIGLYIVSSILKAHKFKLSYFHKNSYTYFEIDINKQS